MVVVPEPSVKGGAPLAAVAVERAVGPAAEHGADESLCLAVGLRAICTRAQVTDLQRPASDRMDHRAIAGAVIGQQLLDGHAVALEEGDGSPQEGDDRDGLLVA
jgi:hypothetical protein